MADPIGLAVTRGVVTVSDTQRSAVLRFDAAGNLVDAWMTGRLGASRPMHITATGKHLLVADFLKDEILVLDDRGDIVSRFGESGSDFGQFDSPAGVAVGADGSIFVADFNNHSIRRLDADGSFSHVWGGKGHEPGQFYYPTDVAVGPDGRVYVADFGNARVQVFTVSDRTGAIGKEQAGW